MAVTRIPFRCLDCDAIVASLGARCLYHRLHPVGVTGQPLTFRTIRSSRSWLETAHGGPLPAKDLTR